MYYCVVMCLFVFLEAVHVVSVVICVCCSDAKHINNT